MRQARDVRRVIGYVPQALSADGSLTGFENLLIFAKLYEVPDGERGKRIRGALELMGLRDAGNKLVRTYSGGMIRRLEVAQAMLRFPQVLFLSIFYGIAVIWERDLGVIHKSLAEPHAAPVLGKAPSAGLRALPQAIIIFVVALLLGVQLNANPLSLVGALLTVLLGAACFSTFSVLIACLLKSLKSRERVMGIGQVLTMPLFFASNAIYPVSIMPGWLQVIARINPLSYMVDALRTLMLVGYTTGNALLLDYGVLLVIGAILIALAARMYPKLVQ